MDTLEMTMTADEVIAHLDTLNPDALNSEIQRMYEQYTGPACVPQPQWFDDCPW